MGGTPMEMHKLFFGPREADPDLTEDVGLSCNRPDTQVSDLVFGPLICLINLHADIISSFE